ncbi:thiamine-phosphate kinase [Ahrensia sp. R2A130]|uniref:thiamine-phosphate kinase n=1 Tax=Ahrensia sp. R2A130 TaxID=744979 RepID=UPI0001E083B9|nr:thiamine-phosphate kinase [Ahrensia sp. R2A130]EFL90525.1 thiamine-monophosphate kinase [Ahrensia sp. R2A130]
MAADETHFIQTYLAPLASPAALGLRDDAACLSPSAGTDLVITADTLVQGTHFLPDDRPFDIAVKAITANLSDLIAKGADPVGYTLALAFPESPSDDWMKQFADGLSQQAHGLLLGGDMTVGGDTLVISVTAFGEVPQGKIVQRRGASVGDVIFLSGCIGTSGAGLQAIRDVPWAKQAGLSAAEISELASAYSAPMIAFPDLVAGLVRTHATASMDVSDGLLLDLQRLCKASEVGAVLQADSVPLNAVVSQLVDAGAFSLEDAFTAGDDYVVLFTAPASALSELTSGPMAKCHHIGTIQEVGSGVVVTDVSGQPMPMGTRAGYDHFSGG